MPFHGNVGRTYSRHDVTAAIGLRPTSQGNWSTGYPRVDDEFFVFATIGGPGRVGPGYETYWENGELSWPTDNDGHLAQVTVRDLISNAYRVHVFVRYSSRSDFLYAGPAIANRVDGERPVRVWWAFDAVQMNAELKGMLAVKGFQLHVPGAHAQLATREGISVYVKTRTEDFPLVLPPSFEGNIEDLISVNGVIRAAGEAFYHNSGMSAFPKRLNGGRTRINFGLAFGFENADALSTFLDMMLALSPPETGTTNGTRGGRRRQADPRTETEAMRAARLGQSGFRSDLLLRYNETCALTGVDMPEILRASHIMPWHKASGSERLDPDNGLLLSVHLDLLFDKGLISFENNGIIKLSPRLKTTVIAAYGLTRELKLTEVFPGNLPYLDFHRLHVFKKD